MWGKKHIKTSVKLWAISLVCLFGVPVTGAAITPLPIPPPGSGSYGLEATKTQPPPTGNATISVPGNGSSFNTSPITVSGICPDGLLVQIYNNDVMVGSVMCTNGSFSLQVSLFNGENRLTASVFDDLDQGGKESNIVTVNYNNANFQEFAQQITLTSNFGRRGANPGTTLTWPLQLSGGTGPYAFSINWGDGTPAELKSQATTGVVDIAHIYSKAGIYKVTIKVTDSKGATAYLQVVAVANGNVQAPSSSKPASTTTTSVRILWWPAAICLMLLIPAFWLGRRTEREAQKHKYQ